MMSNVNKDNIAEKYVLIADLLEQVKDKISKASYVVDHDREENVSCISLDIEDFRVQIEQLQNEFQAVIDFKNNNEEKKPNIEKYINLITDLLKPYYFDNDVETIGRNLVNEKVNKITDAEKEQLKKTTAKQQILDELANATEIPLHDFKVIVAYIRKTSDPNILKQLGEKNYKIIDKNNKTYYLHPNVYHYSEEQYVNRFVALDSTFIEQEDIEPELYNYINLAMNEFYQKMEELCSKPQEKYIFKGEKFYKEKIEKEIQNLTNSLYKITEKYKDVLGEDIINDINSKIMVDEAQMEQRLELLAEESCFNSYNIKSNVLYSSDTITESFRKKVFYDKIAKFNNDKILFRDLNLDDADVKIDQNLKESLKVIKNIVENIHHNQVFSSNDITNLLNELKKDNSDDVMFFKTYFVIKLMKECGITLESQCDLLQSLYDKIQDNDKYKIIFSLSVATIFNSSNISNTCSDWLRKQSCYDSILKYGMLTSDDYYSDLIFQAFNNINDVDQMCNIIISNNLLHIAIKFFLHNDSMTPEIEESKKALLKKLFNKLLNDGEHPEEQINIIYDLFNGLSFHNLEEQIPGTTEQIKNLLQTYQQKEKTTTGKEHNKINSIDYQVEDILQSINKSNYKYTNHPVKDKDIKHMLQYINGKDGFPVLKVIDLLENMEKINLDYTPGDIDINDLIEKFKNKHYSRLYTQEQTKPIFSLISKRFLPYITNERSLQILFDNSDDDNCCNVVEKLYSKINENITKDNMEGYCFNKFFKPETINKIFKNKFNASYILNRNFYKLLKEYYKNNEIMQIIADIVNNSIGTEVKEKIFAFLKPANDVQKNLLTILVDQCQEINNVNLIKFLNQNDIINYAQTIKYIARYCNNHGKAENKIFLITFKQMYKLDDITDYGEIENELKTRLKEIIEASGTDEEKEEFEDFIEDIHTTTDDYDEHLNKETNYLIKICTVVKILNGIDGIVYNHLKKLEKYINKVCLGDNKKKPGKIEITNEKNNYLKDLNIFLDKEIETINSQFDSVAKKNDILIKNKNLLIQEINNIRSVVGDKNIDKENNFLNLLCEKFKDNKLSFNREIVNLNTQNNNIPEKMKNLKDKFTSKVIEKIKSEVKKIENETLKHVPDEKSLEILRNIKNDANNKIYQSTNYISKIRMRSGENINNVAERINKEYNESILAVKDEYKKYHDNLKNIYKERDEQQKLIQQQSINSAINYPVRIDYNKYKKEHKKQETQILNKQSDRQNIALSSINTEGTKFFNSTPQVVVFSSTSIVTVGSVVLSIVTLNPLFLLGCAPTAINTIYQTINYFNRKDTDEANSLRGQQEAYRQSFIDVDRRKNITQDDNHSSASTMDNSYNRGQSNINNNDNVIGSQNMNLQENQQFIN